MPNPAEGVAGSGNTSLVSADVSNPTACTSSVRWNVPSHNRPHGWFRLDLLLLLRDDGWFRAPTRQGLRQLRHQA
jgi:hypothetical protein